MVTLAIVSIITASLMGALSIGIANTEIIISVNLQGLVASFYILELIVLQNQGELCRLKERLI